LQKVFAARDGNPVQALSSVSLDIAKGEFLTIVGPSGCGKSTLLRLVAGLADPSEGELLLNGSPITGPQRDMGIVFQSPVLFPWRSVMDNVLLPADVLKLDRRDARNRAEELRLYGIAGAADLPATVDMAGQTFSLETTTMTTAAGLIVAIPAVVILQWFDRRIERISHRMRDAATRLLYAPDA